MVLKAGVASEKSDGCLAVIPEPCFWPCSIPVLQTTVVWKSLSTAAVKVTMNFLNFTVENSTLASRPWKHGMDYWSSFELYPEWKGNHHIVFRGIAHHRRDYMSATEVVVKALQHQQGDSDTWRAYLSCSAAARKMAGEFNSHVNAAGCSTKVMFLVPTDVVMDNISDVMKFTRIIMRFSKHFSEDEVVVFEELLEGEFKTFVTTDGMAKEIGCGILDSFSHFTYHQSGGQFVVCNLKGVKDEEDGNFKLTNPDIHSMAGNFGSKDKGKVGIKRFFKNHVCTNICNNFIKPDEFTTPSAPYLGEADETGTKSLQASDDHDGVLNPCFEQNDEQAPPPYHVTDPMTPPPYECSMPET